MKAKVAEQGVLIPKAWLEGVDEGEIRRENDTITIYPATADDPIFELGKHPITIDVDDASDNHDHYLL